VVVVVVEVEVEVEVAEEGGGGLGWSTRERGVIDGCRRVQRSLTGGEKHRR